EDVRLLEATADQIAIALEHGRLNAELRQQVYELTRVQDELLQAQRLAADANRAKDEFLATLSHELRTPLQSMLVCVDLLRRQELDQSITARTLDMLERSVRTQTLLIGDLLDMSRITAGKLRLERREMDLVSTIRAAVEEPARAATQKGVTLAITLHPAVGRVLGDPVRLEQIVTNLVANAVKFTPRGGRIDVRLEPHEEIARILISDTGE